jgi:hypothetical protein
VTRRQQRLKRTARRRILGALAVTPACAAWLCASGMASAITT